MPIENPESNIEDPEDGGTAAFWDARYAEEKHLFGTAPNAFIAEEAHRLPEGAEVVELGAGEGRNLVFLAKARGCRVTAVDFAAEGLKEAERLAAAESVELETIRADVRIWKPERTWSGVLVTFLQLLPEERPAFYRLIQKLLRPGGLFLAEWFRPAHAGAAYADIGPPDAERLISAEELHAHFPEAGILRCEEVDRDLDDGPVLQGRSAIVQFVYRQPA